MIPQKFSADQNGIKQSLEYIQNALQQRKLNSNEQNRTLLLAEETVVKLLKYASEKSSLFIGISSVLGTTKILLRCKGSEFNLQEELAEKNLQDIDDSIDESAQEYIQNLLFKRFEDCISYKYKNGESTIRISVKKKKSNPLLQILSIVLAAVIFSLLLNHFAPANLINTIHDYILTPIKTAFLSAINLIVGPVVFFSIITSVSSFENLSSFGKIGLKIIGSFILVSVIAQVIGYGVDFAISFIHTPKTYFDTSENITSATEYTSSLTNILQSIIPSNFASPFLEGNMLQVIFLGIFCGIALSLIKSQSKVLRDFFEACNELCLKMTSLLAKFIPLFIFVTTMILVLEFGLDIFKTLTPLLIALFLGLSLQFVAYMLLIPVTTRTSPFPLFKKFCSEIAISVCALGSSCASIPLSIQFCEERLGISKKIPPFSIPLGATILLDGAILHQVVLLLYFSHVCGIDVSLPHLLTIAAATFVLSLGMPGIPGAPVVALTILFKTIGLPMEALGLAIAFSLLTGIPTTLTNVLAKITCTFITAKSENMVDMGKYRET